MDLFPGNAGNVLKNMSIRRHLFRGSMSPDDMLFNTNHANSDDYIPDISDEKVSNKLEPYFYEREKLPNHNDIDLIRRRLKLRNKLRKENEK